MINTHTRLQDIWDITQTEEGFKYITADDIKGVLAYISDLQKALDNIGKAADLHLHTDDGSDLITKHNITLKDVRTIRSLLVNKIITNSL